MPKTNVNIITEDNPIPAYLFIKEMYKPGDRLMYISAKDTEDDLDAAIKLFSNNQPNEFIVRPPFENVKKELNDLTIEFLKKYPKPRSNLKSL